MKKSVLVCAVVCFAVLALLGLFSIKRIETGEVGLRVGFDKQIAQDELVPGSFNQTLIGSVLTFPVKDVSVRLDDLTPLAKDNSTMADFDTVIIYNINPSNVAELYSTKSKSFHHEDGGDIFLMYNYVQGLARNAIYRSARKYEALTMNDSREAMQMEIKAIIDESLATESLSNAITVNQVLIRAITPAVAVVASANALVQAKNELITKEIGVKIAEMEAKRMAALSQQGAQSIAYMNAQSLLNISEGVKAGKVQTIIVPANFNGLMMK